MAKRKRMSEVERKARARARYIKKRDERYAHEAKERAERRAYVEDIKNRLGADVVNSMYDNIDYEVLKSAVDNAEWILDTEFKSHGYEIDWILSNYSKQSSLAGSMDYEDHRNDTIEDIKPKVYKDIKSRLMQNLQYYNINNKIFDVIRVQLIHGSWSVEPYWSDDAPGYSSIA